MRFQLGKIGCLLYMLKVLIIFIIIITISSIAISRNLVTHEQFCFRFNMSVSSWSNWNLEVGRENPDYPERKLLLLEQEREQTTNSTHMWRRCQSLNPGHIAGSDLTTVPPLLPLRRVRFNYTLYIYEMGVKCVKRDPFLFKSCLLIRPFSYWSTILKLLVEHTVKANE